MRAPSVDVSMTHFIWSCLRDARSPLAIAALLVCAVGGAAAQSSGGSIELHANGNVTPAAIGLPQYPGAHAYHDASSDSAGDIGFTFGTFHFRLLVSKFITGASQATVLEFYRVPLSKYGDVLECEHGEAVGMPRVARSGLTCSDDPEHRSRTGSEDREARQLRSGTPERYRVVAVEPGPSDSTRFTLLLFEVPKEDRSGSR